jgi:hypothetical protein
MVVGWRETAWWARVLLEFEETLAHQTMTTARLAGGGGGRGGTWLDAEGTEAPLSQSDGQKKFGCWDAKQHSVLYRQPKKGNIRSFLLILISSILRFCLGNNNRR